MRPANGSATVFHTNAAQRRRCPPPSTASTSSPPARRRRERPLGRRRHVGDDGVEQRLHADVGRAPTCRPPGRSAPAATPRLRPDDQLVLRQRAGVEELLHQRVVGFGDHLDQRLARASAPAPSMLGRDRRLRSACRCRRSAKVHAFIGDQIDDAAEALLLADRQLDRDDRAAEHAAQRLERAVEAGALAIEPVEHDEPRQLQLLGGRSRPSRSGPRRRPPRRRRPAPRRRRAAPRARRSGSWPCPACR